MKFFPHTPLNATDSSVVPLPHEVGLGPFFFSFNKIRK